MAKKELTEKQLLFCQYYITDFNATMAYKKSHNCTYNTARTEGSRFLAKPNIKRKIKELKKNVNKDIMLESKDVFELMVRIAFSNMADFAEWGHTIERKTNMIGDYIKNEKGEYLTYVNNYVKAIDSNEIDNQLVQEISQGKDGFKIKLVEKKYALDYLIKFFDMFPDSWKRKIEERKLELMDKEADSKLEAPTLIDSIEEKLKLRKIEQ